MGDEVASCLKEMLASAFVKKVVIERFLARILKLVLNLVPSKSHPSWKGNMYLTLVIPAATAADEAKVKMTPAHIPWPIWYNLDLNITLATPQDTIPNEATNSKIPTRSKPRWILSKYVAGKAIIEKRTKSSTFLESQNPRKAPKKWDVFSWKCFLTVLKIEAPVPRAWDR